MRGPGTHKPWCTCVCILPMFLAENMYCSILKYPNSSMPVNSMHSHESNHTAHIMVMYVLTSQFTIELFVIVVDI